jgi:hypothetical protein
MAVYRRRLAGVTIEIHDVDHGPPHCHVSGSGGGAVAQVSLLTLEVVKPSGLRLPRAVLRALKDDQIAMLVAWNEVISIDRGE